MCIIQLQGRIRWHVNKPEMATEAVPPQINRLRIGQPVASVRALLARNRRAPESRLAPTGQRGLGVVAATTVAVLWVAADLDG